MDMPPDLQEWVEQRAEELGLEPETLVVQMIDSFRTSPAMENADLGAGTAGGSTDVSPAVVRSMVKEELDSGELLEEAVESAVDDRAGDLEAVTEDIETRLLDRVDQRIDERVNDLEAATEAMENNLLDRVDERLEERAGELRGEFERELTELRSDYEEDLSDVRSRVVQVKRESDSKASLEEFEATRQRLKDLEKDLASIRDDLDELAGGLEETDEAVAALETSAEETETTLAGVSDRVDTLGWVVSDLRENAEMKDERLTHIKERAASLDVDRAKCERCGEGVEIGLLTDSRCPHCEADLGEVAAASGFFGKPKLLPPTESE